MKYGVYTKVTGKVRSHALALLTANWEKDGWEKIAETRTKAEAAKIVHELGWITLA